jgi:hypothetical protein
MEEKYYIWIWKQWVWEADQEIDGKMKWGRMEEAPENGKELLHSAHANGMNEWMNEWNTDWSTELRKCHIYHHYDSLKWIFLSLFQVRNIFVHEEYNSSYFENDIAMLILNSSVQITAEVRPVCLWNQGDTSLQSITGKDGVVRSNLQVTFIILEYVKI